MRSAPQIFTNVVELTSQSVSGAFESELRGNDIPPNVQAILFKMPTSGKASTRQVFHYKGNLSPSIDGLATSVSGGKGRALFENKATPKTPVLIRTDAGFATKEVVVLHIPPVDGSYRFNDGIQIFGLIP